MTLLAQEACLSRRSVSGVLAGMERKGWLVREHAFAECGRKAANRYRLTIWDVSWALVDRAGNALGQEVPYLDRAGGALGIGQEVHGDRAGGAHKEDQEKKNKKKKSIEPPLPPTARGEHRPEAVATGPCRDEGQEIAAPEPQPSRDRDGFLIHPAATAQPEALPRPEAPLQPQAPIAAQPQPQQPNAPRPLPEPPDPEAEAPVNPKGQRRRAAGFQPIEGDVPAALLPIARELLAFWACKGGQRTKRAWVAQLGQLERIQGDARGGTEAVRAQLEAGSQAAVFGKPWMAVTFANWERYGRPATPIVGTGFSGKRPSQTEAGAAAAAFIRERDARLAAQAAQQADVITVPVLALAEVA